MAITANIIGVEISDSSPSGSQSATVTFRATSTAKLDPLKSTDMASLRDATCGAPLSPLPKNTWATTALLSTMRLRTWRWRPVPNTATYTYDVIGQYSSEYTWAKLSGGGGTDKLLLPVEVSMEAGERTILAWRTAATPAAFATAPAHSYGKSYDIGGTKIDDAGKPTQVRVPTLDVRISLVHDVSNATAGTLVTIYDKIATVQGTWNNAAFLHWVQYEVFCTSANVTQIRDEYYRVTYNFRWDYWKDCSQIPEMDNDGRTKNDGSGRAKNVFWTGLARGSSDHNVIFNTLPDPVAAKQWAKEGSWLTYP